MYLSEIEFKKMPPESQTYTIYYNLEALTKSLKYRIAFYATTGGIIGGALTVIGKWSFWG